MGKELSEWSCAVKLEMMRRGITCTELANVFGIERSHLSAVINGRVSSEPLTRRINDYFNIPNGDFVLDVNYIPKLR